MFSNVLGTLGLRTLPPHFPAILTYTRMLPDLARSPDLGLPDLARSGIFFFFFEKKNFPRRPRSGQIWPHLGDLGRLGKFFFPGTPNDITKYRLKYRSIYVARVCKLRSRTHKVYQTINQSDKRYIIGKLLAPPPCLRIYYVDRPNSVGLRRSSAKHWGST